MNNKELAAQCLIEAANILEESIKKRNGKTDIRVQHAEIATIITQGLFPYDKLPSNAYNVFDGQYSGLKLSNNQIEELKKFIYELEKLNEDDILFFIKNHKIYERYDKSVFDPNKIKTCLYAKIGNAKNFLSTIKNESIDFAEYSEEFNSLIESIDDDLCELMEFTLYEDSSSSTDSQDNEKKKITLIQRIWNTIKRIWEAIKRYVKRIIRSVKRRFSTMKTMNIIVKEDVEVYRETLNGFDSKYFSEIKSYFDAALKSKRDIYFDKAMDGINFKLDKKIPVKAGTVLKGNMILRNFDRLDQEIETIDQKIASINKKIMDLPEILSGKTEDQYEKFSIIRNKMVDYNQYLQAILNDMYNFAMNNVSEVIDVKYKKVKD